MPGKQNGREVDGQDVNGARLGPVYTCQHVIGARDHKTCSEDSSVASGLLKADDGKQYDWRLIIGLLVVPEASYHQYAATGRRISATHHERGRKCCSRPRARQPLPITRGSLSRRPPASWCRRQNRREAHRSAGCSLTRMQHCTARVAPVWGGRSCFRRLHIPPVAACGLAPHARGGC